MAYFDVEESFYFEQKLAQLKALDPALYGNWEVAQVQAAFAEAGLSAQEHFDQYGWAEELSANATFDVAKYLAAKAAQLNEAAYEGKTDWTSADVVAAFQAAGLSAEAHFTQYGEAEGLEAQPVEGAPSTLTEALANLKAAQDARTEFLEGVRDQLIADEFTYDDDADALTPEVAVVDGTNVEVVAEIIGDILEDAQDTVGGLVNDTAFSTRTDAIQDALIADKETSLNADLSSAITKAGAGVEALLSAAEAAKKAYVAKVQAQAAAADDVTAAVGAVEALDDAGDNVVSLNATALMAAADGEEIDDGAGVVFAAFNNGAWEATDEGLEIGKFAELIAALNANLAAVKQTESALTALKKAVEKVYITENSLYSADVTAAVTVGTGAINYDASVTGYKTKADSEAGVAAVATVFTIDSIADGTYEVDGDTFTVTGGVLSGTGTTWNASIEGATIEFTAVTAGVQATPSTVAFDDGTNPPSTEATTEVTAGAAAVDKSVSVTAGKSADVVEAQAAIKSFAEAVAELKDARELAGQLEAADQKVEDAFDALEELEVALLDATTFTAENDVWLFEGVDASLDEFGDEGLDQIFFGDKYTLVALEAGKTVAGKVGAVDAFEIFWEQKGADLILYVENEAFAGNATGDDDFATITLTGVTSEEVNFENGFLIAGTAAA